MARRIMPSYGSSYSDGEVADVLNYVTRSFGAARAHLTARQVYAL